MHIEHMALWTHQLESLRHFYEHYFGAQAGACYDNPAKGFSSYFLSFDSGARLELMSRADIPVERLDPVLQRTGFIHLCFALGSVEAVDAFMPGRWPMACRYWKHRAGPVMVELRADATRS